MKRYISSLLGLVLVGSFVLPLGASAQTTTGTNLGLIQSLTAQIQSLQQQILGLQTQQTQLQASSTAAMQQLVATLSLGSSGDQVTLLQTLLAADPSLYPEGKITGFFGGATQRALKRFQQKNGLGAVGFVGPKTREALNTLLRSQFQVATSLDATTLEQIRNLLAGSATSTIGGTVVSAGTTTGGLCDIPSLPFNGPIISREGKVKIIQTGNSFIYQDGKHRIIITPNTYIERDGKKQLIITPNSYMQRDGKFRLTLPCGGTTSTPTTTPPTAGDVTAPIVTGISASAMQTSAMMKWHTNEASVGKIYYSAAMNFNPATSSSVSESNIWWWLTPTLDHSVSISSLVGSTTYYYVIEVKDKAGNTATSSVQSFTTKSSNVIDTYAPSLSAITINNVSASSAQVSWQTSESANGRVYYSTTTPLSTSTALSAANANYVPQRWISLTNLMPNTTYYFVVQSQDPTGNTTTSSQSSFQTLSAPSDTTAPTLSNVFVAPASTTANITWTTNEAATGRIYFGTTTPLSLASAMTAATSSLSTSHALQVTGLVASTTYYFLVASADGANNNATSSQYSFVTGQ